MAMIFDGNAAAQYENYPQGLSAVRGGNRSTIVLWARPTESQAANAYMMSETVNAADTGHRWGVRMLGTDVTAEWNRGANDIKATAATAGCIVNQWNLLIVERDGDVISLWVLNAGTNRLTSAERLWKNTGPHATVTGCGTASFNATMACLNFGRSPTNINLADPNGLGLTVQRFRGHIAFAAGYPGKLNRRDKALLFNMGVPNRLAMESLSIKPTYVATGSDSSLAVGYGDSLVQNVTGTFATFTANDSIWPGCLDPIRLSTAPFLALPNLREMWTFQEAPNGTSSVFTGLKNGIQLTYSTSPSGNGAGANIVRRGDGLFGPYSVELNGVGLWVNPAQTAWNNLLRFSGPGARLTALIWAKVRQSFAADIVADQPQMGLLCGVWDESDSQNNRQWAAFHSLADTNGFSEYIIPNTVNCHTSHDGGDSPGQAANYEVAFSGAGFEMGTWQCFGITWDGTYSRAYLNGRLIPSPRNPFNPGAAYGIANYALYNSIAPFRVGGVDTTGGGGWGNYARCAYSAMAVLQGAASEDQMYRYARGAA